MRALIAAVPAGTGREVLAATAKMPAEVRAGAAAPMHPAPAVGVAAGQPTNAMQVRDLIRDHLRFQVDHGSDMETSGGANAADLWVCFGGVEFFVQVRPCRPLGDRD